MLIIMTLSHQEKIVLLNAPVFFFFFFNLRPIASVYEALNLIEKGTQ